MHDARVPAPYRQLRNIRNLNHLRDGGVPDILATTETPVVPQAPALHRPSLEQGARKVLTGVDAHRIADPLNRPRRRRILFGAVAHLTPDTPASTHHFAAIESTGEVFPNAERHVERIGQLGAWPRRNPRSAQATVRSVTVAGRRLNADDARRHLNSTAPVDSDQILVVLQPVRIPDQIAASTPKGP